MGEYEKREYFGVEWRVFVVNSLEEGIAAIQRGEEAVRIYNYDDKKKIKDDGAKHVAAVLKNNRTLMLLDLGSNQISDQGAGSLAEALKVNSTLTTLYLQYNDEIGPEGAGSLAEALKVNSTLTTLNFSFNRIGPKGAGSLAEALKVNSTLTTLDLSNRDLDENYIGPEGAGLLAEALKVHSVYSRASILTMLDLYWNNIGPEGAGSLAEALKVNSTLTALNLRYNKIGDQGAGSLAEALKVNSTLTYLNLQYNEIGPEGAGSLAEALKVNNTLTSLSLELNNIGPEGAGLLAKALKVNSTLATLDLSSNSIGGKGGQALADAIEFAERNNTLALTDISLEYNNIPSSIEARIAQYVTVSYEYTAFENFGQEALREDVLAPWGRVKLMFVGKGAAGKTSTVRSLLGEKFVKTHDSTIGMDLTTTTAVSAEEKFEKGERKPLAEALAKHKGLSQRKSYDSRKHMRRVSNRHASTKHPVPAERTPLETVEEDGQFVESELAQAEESPKAFKVERGDVLRQYDGELIARFEGKSTRDAKELSFSLWDYGGQEVFYALHHLFLTQYGLYVVVFDMQEALADEANCISFLRFWIKSIALHAPGAPFILVGTRMDVVKSRKRHLRIHDLLEQGLSLNECDGLVANAQDELCFFPVDNKSDKRTLLQKAMRKKKKDRVPVLRQAIVATCFKQEYVDKLVRLRWLLVLEKLKKDSSKSFWLLEEVEQLCEDHDVENCLEMLAFFHELGVLVHLTATEELRRYVVIRPQWLLDGITLIIRDKDIHMNKAWRRKLKTSTDLNSRLKMDVDAWIEKGLVSRALVEYLVDRFGAEKGWSEKDVDYLLEVMRNMQLASVWETEDESDVFVVPSLLPRAPVSWLSSDCARFHQDDCSMCWIQFDFLPTGLFARFLSSMVRHFGNRNYKTRVEDVYLDHAMVVFNEECSFLVSADAAKNRVIARFDLECEENVPTIVRLLSDEFTVLSKNFMHGKLKTEIILSSNGTDSEDACVAYALFKKAHQDGKKKCESLKKGTFVKLEVLSIFQSTIGMTLESSSEAQEFDVFLSHNWGDDAHGRDNHKRVEEIAKKLRDRGLRVFLDSWHVKGNLDVAMSSGIDRSRVFVVFVTQKYMDKVNSSDKKDHCWAEFQYAVTRGKILLPVVMESGVVDQSKWCGTFLFRTGKETYVNLSADNAIEEEGNIQWLYDTIKKHIC